MADSYSFVKGGKLKLKGSKEKSHKKHKKHKRKREHEDDAASEVNDDILRHGGWWCVENMEEITGGIAIEIGHMGYTLALDNGLFTRGKSHDVGEGPDPEEILSAMKLSDTKIALKSGFDKFLSVDQKNRVVGRSDAIGPREQFEPIFQDGKLALMGCNSCFVALGEGDKLFCQSQTAGDEEVIQIRSCAPREKKKKSDLPEDVKTTMKETEIAYIRKFQSFKDMKLQVNPRDRAEMKDAKKEGNLHEVMLDRRVKMKSDRYC